MSFKKLWCICVVILESLLLCDGVFLRCYKDSIQNYEVATLEEAEKLLNTTCYNSALKNLIYAFGYEGKTDGNATVSVISTAIKLKDRNVFLLDWQREASSVQSLGSFGSQLSYVFSALPQTILVGRKLGQALLRLVLLGFNLLRTELMGHSLGAHTMGNAGRQVKDGGKTIQTITGLDPAGPFFDTFLFDYPALDKTCAKFVRSYHTDPGQRGLNSSLAHVDVWFNYGNFITGEDASQQVQPGCPTGNFEMFSPGDLCSHNLSWEYMTEAWLINSFLASNGSDYYAWERANRTYEIVISLGDDIDRSARGNFFLVTNATAPHGEGEAGLTPTNIQ